MFGKVAGGFIIFLNERRSNARRWIAKGKVNAKEINEANNIFKNIFATHGDHLCLRVPGEVRFFTERTRRPIAGSCKKLDREVACLRVGRRPRLPSDSRLRPQLARGDDAAKNT